jgi:hypothetical protein
VGCRHFLWTVRPLGARGKGEGNAESCRLRELAYDPHRAFYLILYFLALVWREAFRFLFNAQFLGADVASLLPRDLSVGKFVSTFLAIIVFVWLFGYAWGWLYNGLAQRT